jgi:predicted negative regulator of RcsB-dependent stress response
MRSWARRLCNALRAALVVATIVSTWQALGWSYRNVCPAGRREVAMARSEVLFQEGLDALHVRGDRLGALRAWSDELDIYRAYPGADAEHAGCLERIGDILLDSGRDAEALEKYEQALVFYGRSRYAELDQARCRRKITELRAC